MYAASPSCRYRPVMDVHWWAAAVVASSGAVGLAFAIRGIAGSRDSRWVAFYPRYRRHVDQRWLIPIAILIDTIFAVVGLAESASTTYWISWAITVAVQFLFLVSVLSLTWLRGRSKHRTEHPTRPPME